MAQLWSRQPFQVVCIGLPRRLVHSRLSHPEDSLLPSQLVQFTASAEGVMLVAMVGGHRWRHSHTTTAFWYSTMNSSLFNLQFIWVRFGNLWELV